MTEVHEQPREFQIPNGCPMCAADLPVRVTEHNGAAAVCKHCGWFGRPQITVTHRGWSISYEGAAA
jgi:hypothetical protein